MTDYDRCFIWVVLSVAMSRTYDPGSAGWWFWNGVFLFWAVATVALVAKAVAVWFKQRDRA